MALMSHIAVVSRITLTCCFTALLATTGCVTAPPRSPPIATDDPIDASAQEDQSSKEPSDPLALTWAHAEPPEGACDAFHMSDAWAGFDDSKGRLMSILEPGDNNMVSGYHAWGDPIGDDVIAAIVADQAALIDCKRDAEAYLVYARAERWLIGKHKDASPARALAAFDIAIDLSEDCSRTGSPSESASMTCALALSHSADLVRESPAPSSFIKARLDHLNGQAIDDEHWLNPTAKIARGTTHTLTGSSNGYLRLWDNVTADLLWETRLSAQRITGLAFIDVSAAVAAVGQELIVFDLEGGAERRRFTVPPCEMSCVTSVYLIGGRLFTITYTPTPNFGDENPVQVRLWSIAEGSVLLNFEFEGSLRVEDIQVINNTLVTYIKEWGEDDNFEPVPIESVVEFRSLSDGRNILTSKIPSLYDASTRGRYSQHIVRSPDDALAAWITDNETDADPTLLNVFVPSEDTFFTLPIPIRTDNYKIAFSHDHKSIAVAYGTQMDTLVIIADIKENGIENARQHIIKRRRETTEDDDDMTFAASVSSLVFSEDNSDLFIDYDFVEYAYTPNPRASPEVIDLKTGAVALTVATAEVSKTKRPRTQKKNPVNDPALAKGPEIPPAAFKNKYISLATFSLASSPDGAVLAGLRVASFKDSVVWSVNHPPIVVPLTDYSIFHADHQLFDVRSASCSPPEYDSISEGTIERWDLTTMTREVVYSDPKFLVSSVQQLPDGQLLICQELYEEDISACDIDDEIRNSGSERLVRFNPKDNSLTPIAVLDGQEPCDSIDPSSLPQSPDGQYTLDTTEDNKLCVLDAETHGVVFNLNEAVGSYGSQYFFSPDSRYLAVILEEPPGSLQLFDIQSRTLRAVFDDANTAAFASDGRRLVFAQNNSLHIIDIETLMPLLTLSEHTKPIEALLLSADGSTLFSLQTNGITIAWDWTAISAYFDTK